MKYYSHWQNALIDFISWYGHNYTDGYNLVVEFEKYITRNNVGTYILEEPK